MSPSAEVLLVSRALLGIASASIMPSTLALIIAMFPNPRQTGTAIAVWATALTAGVALGPVAGALMLNVFWWGSVFPFAVPFTLAVVVLGPSLLPNTRTRGGSTPRRWRCCC